MTSHAFLKPSGYIAIIRNGRGDFIAIGDTNGHPFASHGDANDFADAFRAAMPYAIQIATVPIQPSGLDVDDPEDPLPRPEPAA